MPPGKTPRRAGACAIAALALLCAVLATAASAVSARTGEVSLSSRLDRPNGGGNGAYVPGEAIVRFDPAATAKARERARGAADVDFVETLGLPRAQVV